MPVTICSIFFLLLILGGVFLSTVNAAQPSFGHVSVGSSSKASFGGLYVCNFTSPTNLGNITQIETYLATGGSSMKAVIYSDNNGAPDVLLAESSEVRQEGTSGKWITFDVSYSGTPNTVYWMGIILLEAGTYYYTSGVSGKAVYFSSESEATNAFPQTNFYPGEDMSIYASYLPTTSATAQLPDWTQTVLIWVAIAGLVTAALLAIIFFKAKNRNKTG
jgi:hypothetical protein